MYNMAVVPQHVHPLLVKQVPDAFLCGSAHHIDIHRLIALPIPFSAYACVVMCMRDSAGAMNCCCASTCGTPSRYTLYVQAYQAP